jgi:hypothetical protein
MALDVCYTLNQFCAPLPETYGDFKAMATTFLPNIIDTKVLNSPVLWIYGDFKAMATTFLPNIIDTKVLNSGYQCCGSTGTSRPWPPPSCPTSSTLRY